MGTHFFFESQRIELPSQFYCTLLTYLQVQHPTSQKMKSIVFLLMGIFFALSVSDPIPNGVLEALEDDGNGDVGVLQMAANDDPDAGVVPKNETNSGPLGAGPLGAASRSTVEGYVKLWIKQNIGSEDKKWARTYIKNMINRQFPDWQYTV